MKFTTRTGSVYEIQGKAIRRVNTQKEHEKRADGEWVRLKEDPVIKLQESAYLILESLAEYGPDDNGTHDKETIYTYRRTSEVVSIEE